MYIVGFNGPPRSGKDTMAEMLADILNESMYVTISTQVRSLSTPMRKMAFSALELPYSVEVYERIKDTEFASLGGMTLRQFMTEMSERFMKPRFGPDIWASLLVESLPKDWTGMVIIPDFGFQSESNFFIKRFGSDNFMLVQTQRYGHNFSNDSRSYVGADRNMTIENNGTPEDLRTEVRRLYGRLVNQLAWKL